MGKFYNIDPNNCSFEELEQAIVQCKDSEEYYHAMEQSCKEFINSVYGAMANKFYKCKNLDIAESITLQGQDLIKYSVKSVNYYFKELWISDEESKRNIISYMKDKFPDFDVDKFILLSKQNLQFGDSLQVYGDSCDKDTMISTTTGVFRIYDLFMENQWEKIILRDKEFVTSKKQIYNYDGKKKIICNIKHVIRHRVTKEKWNICSENNYNVTVTGDHSIIILRNNKIEEVCPRNLQNTDELITLVKGNIEISKIKFAKNIGIYNNEYVYDIEVETEKSSQHNFFGNNILIHNTDSVSKDSIIITNKHKEGITIENLYNENKDNIGDITILGHESVNTDQYCCNWLSNTYFGKIQRIIRHKVKKDKWKLICEDNHAVECTPDHSLMIFRKPQDKDCMSAFKVTPGEVKSTDKVMILAQTEDNNLKGILKNIKSCEKVGKFSDEYVYDIEMDDFTHTFFCNNILVHNSAYITFQPIIQQCGISKDQETTFVIALNKFILEEYLVKMFDDYAKNYNCDKNLEKFECEKIARSVIMLAKKKYVMHLAWKEPNVFLEPLQNVIYKGIEVAQGSIPEVCRDLMKEFIKFIITMLSEKEKIEYETIIRKLKEIKQKFSMFPPNEICKSFTISDYDKFILEDKKSDIIYSDVRGCPIHVKGAALYNNLLYTKAKKYKSKYTFVKTGDKVKFYYIDTKNENNAFSFMPNNYPYEFAPKMDIDLQFEKVILDPCNRIIQAIGYSPVSSTLTFSVGLF